MGTDIRIGGSPGNEFPGTAGSGPDESRRPVSAAGRSETAIYKSPPRRAFGDGARRCILSSRQIRPGAETAATLGTLTPMTTTQPHILLVEDDREISALVARYLRANECRVSLAGDGAAMDKVLADARVDLVVLDLMLPGEDGLSLCRRLRAASGIPILMLTAKAEEIDRIIGLEIGADDYLGKPFNPRELLARIRAILRRGSAAEAETEEGVRRLHFLGWTLDISLRQLLSPEEARIAITGAEFDLLHALCLRPGRVLSRDQLLDLTQGRAAGPFERSIDVLISRIRQKIEPDPRNPEIIRTIRSGGYLFTPEVTRT